MDTMLPIPLTRQSACCHQVAYYDHIKTLPEKEAIIFIKKVHSNTLLARHPVYKCLSNHHIKPFCKM